MTSIYPSTSSTTSATSSSSLLRINGLASGIDTDAVVKSMVSKYQASIDKANQAKQTMGWQQDAYRGIITGIKGLQEYFDPLSSKYMLSGNTFNVNSATSSNDSVATGTPTSNAKTGTYTVKVTQLAKQAKIEGTSLNSTIKVAVGGESNWSNGTSGVTLQFGAGNITLDKSIVDTNKNGTSLDEITANINKQIGASPTLNGTVSASFVSDVTGNYIKFTSTTPTTVSTVLNDATVLGPIAINSGVSGSTKLSDLGIGSNLTFNLSYDATTNATPIKIDLTSASTIQNLMDQVNSETNGAVTVGVDDTTGKISFESKGYGSTTGITINNDIGGNLSNLGIQNTTGATGITQSGQDALVDITEPGQPTVTTTQTSNRFTTNGINYNLISAGTSNLTVTGNADTVVANIKSFITDYNTIIATINTKLSEKPDPAYPPLTDAQKTAMSATQITQWEAKAKVGILRNDSNLSSLMTQLRGTLYTPVKDSSGANVSLSFGKYGTNAVGIDTSTDYTDGGKLVLSDETKLRSAITDNMADFKKLFIGSSTTPVDATKSYIGSKTYNEDSIFQRMNTIIRGYVSDPGLGTDGTFSLNGTMNIFVNKQYDFSSTGTSGKNTLPDQVYAKTISISKFQAQLTAASARYYAQFTALETAMNRLNSQQSALSSMLGSGTSSGA